jgi:RNA polymerase sigma-70 factor (ECF subfamily)
VLSDGEAIGRSISDPATFVNVFDRHALAVHSYLARRAGQQIAEDLAGDIWLAAFNARRRFDTTVDDSLPWLYGIARNVLLSHWRLPRTESVPQPEPVHDPWPEVDDRLDAGSRRSMLRAALSTLAPVDREVLLLNAWEQLTPTEIAVVLNMPAGTVRWRLHKTRRTLAGHDGLKPAEQPAATICEEH